MPMRFVFNLITTLGVARIVFNRMAVSLRDPIKAKIDDRVSFIKYLLQEYPSLLDKWEKDTQKEMETYADECAGGDEDIRLSILSNYMKAFDGNENRKDMFYQAILVMAFSYYESAVTLLSQHANSKEHIKAICASKNITLSAETQRHIDYLQEDINALRNNIAHNNFGTYRKIDTLNKLAEKWDGVHYSDDTITLTDSAIIEDALEKMHHVLSELCDKLGYRNRQV